MAVADASTPDQTTTGAIRNAIVAVQEGRLDHALAAAEQGLADGGDPGALNALLGSLRLRRGDAGSAVAHLDIAHEEHPFDLTIAKNLATALASLGNYERVLKVAHRSLAFQDPSLQLARVRAFAASQLRDFPSAIEALEHVVSAAPEDWESWNNLGNARHCAGDSQGSLQALERSIKLNPFAAPSRLNYALGLRNAGRFQDAEVAFRQMAADFPDDSKPLRELHTMLKQMGRDEEAIDAIDEAVKREPTNIELLLGRASHLLLLQKTEASEAAYRQVLETDPVNSVAFLGIAVARELTNRADGLAALITEAEEAGIRDDALHFMRAYHHRRNKNFVAGLAALEKVPVELETVQRFALLGQLLDGAGRPDDAFAAFSRMNEMHAAETTTAYERGAAYRETVRKMPTVMTQEWANSWQTDAGAPGHASPERPPVFLVGFPRSGTTLLDTILMGHPQIEVLEEEPALTNARALLGDFAALPTATHEQIRVAREAYFRTVSQLTPLAPGKLIVDKNPMSMNLLPIIRRLFPDARIILSVRHPCDVVLSCFMANFRLNDAMASFLDVKTAAELYVLSFSNYEHAQSLMPMPTRTIVYENVITNQEPELRALLAFLELDWHDAVLDHQATALKRGRIKTASYSQVAEPLYRRAVGRWQRYRKYLQPVLPMLSPWIKNFGYTAGS